MTIITMLKKYSPILLWKDNKAHKLKLTDNGANSHKYLLLGLILAGGCFITLSYGANGWDNPFSAAEQFYEKFIFWQLRLPRALIAIFTGMALAASGAIFQKLLRNPLASPDIIGINSGAALGILITIWLAPGYISPFSGAFIGALAAILLVILGNGAKLVTIAKSKIIISGIAINALSLSLIKFTSLELPLTQAKAMDVLLSGSLARQDWTNVLISSLILLLLPVFAWLSKQFNYLDLGEESAISLGVPVRLVQSVAIFIALLLASLAVFIIGPVSFIALCAPHMAKSFFKSRELAFAPIMLMGASITLSADVITLLLPTPGRLPLGTLTALIGGIYLLRIIYSETRT